MLRYLFSDSSSIVNLNYNQARRHRNVAQMDNTFTFGLVVVAPRYQCD